MQHYITRMSNSRNTRGKLRTLRKRSESVTKQIAHLRTEKTTLDAEIQRLTAQLAAEHTRAAIHGKVARSAYRDVQWDCAMKWVEQERDEYVTYLALKHLPTAKKGEASYEFAFYEAVNRGEASCGRGLVGTHLYDARIATAGTRSGSRSYSQFRAQLLELYPTDPETAASFIQKFNAFVEYDKTGKDEEDGSPKIDDAITYLIRAAGFIEV